MQTIGELRDMLARSHNETLQKIIDENQKHPHIYYIILVAYNEGDTDALREKWMVLKFDHCEPPEPRPMLSCMCYKVDNNRGVLDRVWCLPRDTVDKGILLDDTSVYAKEVYASALKCPCIINN
jgi:hypothetical protein